MMIEGQCGANLPRSAFPQGKRSGIRQTEGPGGTHRFLADLIGGFLKDSGFQIGTKFVPEGREEVVESSPNAKEQGNSSHLQGLAHFVINALNFAPRVEFRHRVGTRTCRPANNPHNFLSSLMLGTPFATFCAEKCNLSRGVGWPSSTK